MQDTEDERVQIRAAEAILDRAGVVKAKQMPSSKPSKKVGGEARGDRLDDLL